MSSFLAQLPPTQPLQPGRYGAFPNMPGVVAVRRALSVATLAAGRGAEATLSSAIQTAFGAALPAGPAYVASGGVGFAGIGPGRWTVSSEMDPDALTDKLSAAIGEAGSVFDQSGGVAVYELSGSRLRETLAKLVNIDVDAAAFKAGSAATTSAALIGTTFWMTDDATMQLTVARSYAAAFLRALAGAAAEYGFELR